MDGAPPSPVGDGECEPAQESRACKKACGHPTFQGDEFEESTKANP
jgi:hypothetical protein